jgi:hypothetical protein
MKPADAVYSFIESWYGGSVLPEDGYSSEQLAAIDPSLGQRLPKCVLEWYRTAAGRFNLAAGCIHLVEPAELAIEDELVTLYHDPHAGLLAGLRASDLTNDNPPVVDGIDADSELYPSFWDFALALVIADRLSVDDVAADVRGIRIPRILVVGKSLREAIQKDFSLLPINPLRSYPIPDGERSDLYSSGDILALTDGPNWATMTARTPEAWRELEAFVARHGEPGDPYAHATWLNS